MKLLKKTLAVFLVVLTLFTTCSVVIPVLATYEIEATGNMTSDFMEDAEFDEEIDEPEIISEIIEKREENKKYFMMSDGSFVVAQYNTPIHQNDSGEWIDIDNTITKTEATSEQTILFGTDELYSTSNITRNFVFAEKSNSNTLVSYEAKDYPISLNYQSAKKSEIKIIDSNKELTGNEVFLTLPNVTQEVLYENVFPNVDLQYIVSPTKLKENIIIKSNSAQNSFTVNYNIGELIAEVVNNKTINLMAENEVIYTITAPYMYDANGAISEDVLLSVDKNKNGKLRINITVDSEWLQAEERKFPVVVDPSIVESNAEDIPATCISSNYATTNYGDIGSELRITKEDSTYGTSYALLNMADLVINSNVGYVVSIKLNLPLNSSVSSNINVYLHEIASEWNETSVTWNSKPTISTTVSDYCSLTTSSTSMSFDITKLYSKWISGNGSNGVALKLNDNGNVTFRSEDSENPVILMNYLSTAGIDEEFSYSEFDMGTAGYVYINNLSGNLVLTRDEFDTTGESYPYDFTKTYNSFGYYNEEESVWLESYNSYVLMGISYVDTDGSFEMLDSTDETDSDGYNVLEENKYGWEKSKIIDYIKIPVGLIGTLNLPYTVELLKNESTEKYRFNWDGLVSKHIVEEGTEKLVFSRESTYNEDETINENLYYLVDGDGDKLQVSLTDTSVTYKQYDYRSDSSLVVGDVLIYTNDVNGNVTQITLNGNLQATFTYDSLNRMTSMTNDVGYCLNFGYEGDTPRISSVAESKNGVTGQQVSFTRTYNSTTARTSGADGVFGNGDDLLTTYKFNEKARLIATRSETVDGEKLGTADIEYNNSENTLYNSVSKISAAGKITENLVRNHNVESANNWTSYLLDDSGCVRTAGYTTEESYVGEGSLKINVTDITAMGGASFYQRFYLNEGTIEIGKTYTLSAFVKTSGITRDSNAGTTRNHGASVMMRTYKTDGSSTRTYSHSVQQTNEDINNGWERVFVTFTIPEDAERASAYLVLRNGTGTAYFDGVQLEEGDTPSQYNMLENNNFAFSETTGYASNWSRWNLTSSDVVENGEMRIVGDVGTNKAVYQEVKVTEDDLDDKYVVSGWAHAEPVAKNSSKHYRLHILIYYKEMDSSGNPISYVPTKADFNYYSDELQYTSGSFELGHPTHPEYTPDRIRVVCAYYKQANNACFDTISLIKTSDVYDLTENESSDEPTYTYDSNGCVTSSVYPDGTTYTYTYQLVSGNYIVKTETVSELVDENTTETTVYEYNTQGQLVRLTEPNGTVYNYTYNSDGELLSKLTASGVGDRYTYNENGDILSETYEDGSSYTYTYYDNGELYTETYTENGDTISYVYNTDGTLKTETESDGTVWNYTYNEYGHLISKLKNNGSGDSYTYQYFDFNGNGEYDEYKITYERLENGEETWYTYNSKAVLTQLKQKKNGKELIYNYDTVGKITSVEHNGFKYNYTYDAFGNTTAVKVGSQALVTYGYQTDKSKLSTVTYGNGSGEETYTYNAYGEIIKKSVSGIGDFTYKYDTLSRPVYEQDSGNKQKTYYLYDDKGRLYGEMVNSTAKSNAYLNQLYSIRNILDEEDRVSKETLIANRFTTNIWYNYDETGLCTSSELSSTRKINYTYDEEDRLSTRTLTTGTNVVENYTYNDDSLISAYSIGSDTFAYTYDANGNITEIKKNNVVTQSYVYDSDNQLVRENNADTNKTVVYTYDGCGNITVKKEYAYTTGTVGTATSTINYTYDSTWKDKLVSYNGQTITYDAIGNPTSYMGATMTWNGRKLMSYTDSDTTVTYKYDADGLRTQKTVNGVQYDYYYNNGRLMYEKCGTDYELFYRYDVDGRLFQVVRNRLSDNYKYYHYIITNSFGDVLQIRDGNGNILAKYNYDNWGKLLSITNSSGTAFAENTYPYHMSVRYRGYVYDHETGLYYLQSRYYDPETGRFLNADDMDYIGYSGEDVSYNLFAYCENNPVNNSDPSGMVAISTILGVVMGMVFGAVGYFLDILVSNIDNYFKDFNKFITKIKKTLSSRKEQLKLFIEVLIGATDGFLSTTYKYQLLKNIYNAVINAYNTYSNNFDPWYIVISTILSFLCSKYLKTESVYYKFNFNRVSKSAKDLAKNFKKLNAKRINKFIELVTNQIVYYLKNNTTLYKRFIKNYSLINVSSWISKMPELARQIKTMFKEIKT